MAHSRTVVVTGASSGIGRASAVLLTRSGFTVFAGVRKSSDADALRREDDERIVPVLLDITDSAAVAAAAERVASAVGEHGLDGLVNNAGIGLAAPLEYVTMEEVRRLFEVNLFGQLAVTQAFLPAIRRARGRIVNLGSIGTHIAVPFGGVLNGSKSAFSSLSETLRLELRPFGIRVILIEPASITTPAVGKTLSAPLRGLPQEAEARYGSMLRAFTHRAYEREMHGSSPDVVARVVLAALTARRPRVRYRAGKDARRLAWLPRLLPRRLFERLELRSLGLPATFGAMDR